MTKKYLISYFSNLCRKKFLSSQPNYFRKVCFKIIRSLTNSVVKSKREAKACATRAGRANRGSFDFLFGLTTPEGMPTAKSRDLSKNQIINAPMKNSKKSSAVSKNNEVKKKWETPELSVLDTNFTASVGGTAGQTEGGHGASTTNVNGPLS